MRKVLAIILCMLLLSGCTPEVRDLTCEEIIAAYKEAGYEVSHHHPAELGDIICYIAVENEDGDDIYFDRYATATEAQAVAESRQFHVLIWLFTVIYGDPTWVHTTSYGCYEIEYTDRELYDVFEELIR